MNEFNILNLLIQRHLVSFSSLRVFEVFELQLVDYFRAELFSIFKIMLKVLHLLCVCSLTFGHLLITAQIYLYHLVIMFYY